jgi:hypothetical protein
MTPSSLALQAVEPAGQHAQHRLKRRVDHEWELTSLAGLNDVGRDMEHNAHLPF